MTMKMSLPTLLLLTPSSLRNELHLDCAPLCADDLLAMKACPPSEQEFVDIFQKIKYSLSLVVSNPGVYM